MLLSVTKGLAITTSIFTGGVLTAVSVLTIPALLLGPHSIAVKQFKVINSLGLGAQPPTALVAALLHGFVAWRLASSSSSAGASSRTAVGLWSASAAVMAALVPFTYGLMVPTSSQLFGIAGTAEKREGGTEVAEKTEGLLRRWNKLNAVRGVLAVGAGVLSLWSVLDEALL